MNILLVIDMQVDFISGTLKVPGSYDIIPTINKLIEKFMVGQNTVVFTKDWHKLNSTHFNHWPIHCIEDTEGAEIYPSIMYDEDINYTVYKGQGLNNDGYSAFDGYMEKDAEEGVKFSKDIFMPNTNIYICGVATDFCVKGTALDSKAAGLETYIIADAVAGVTPASSLNAINLLKQVEVKFVMSNQLI